MPNKIKEDVIAKEEISDSSINGTTMILDDGLYMVGKVTSRSRKYCEENGLVRYNYTVNVNGQTQYLTEWSRKTETITDTLLYSVGQIIVAPVIIKSF